MKVLNVGGRVCVDGGDGPVDVATASGGRFGPDPQTVYARWPDFRSWAEGLDPIWAERIDPTAVLPAAGAPLDSPVPRPRQILAAGFNYADHTVEVAADLPTRPLVFPKLTSCISGPSDVVDLPGPHVDWEVELVVVIGRHARHVAAADAWAYVAGLTVGQDLTDRVAQFEGATPQFSLSKSLPGFGRIGPWVTTVDEFDDRDDLAIHCTLNGELVQESRTSHLVFGVGFSRTPPRHLTPDDVLVGGIEGIGELVTTFD